MSSFCFHNKDIFGSLRASLFIERARKREFEAYDGFLSLFMWFTKMFYSNNSIYSFKFNLEGWDKRTI